MKAIDIAPYFIAKSDQVGDPITNKKLQKLLYYAKAWGLVYFEEGVVDEPFYAWIHGPVCKEVYAHYKTFGYRPIEQDYKGAHASDLIADFRQEQPEEMVDFLDAVFDKYAPLTAFQLELLSHSEKPWQEAREGLKPTDRGEVVISEKTMRDFYAAL